MIAPLGEYIPALLEETTMPRYESFLLEFCNVVMGSPEYGGRCWFCPYCDPDPDREHRNDKGKKKPWAAFSVRPPLGRHPIKFRCHRCRVWGDEHDLLNFFYHDEPEWIQYWLDYAAYHYPPERRSRRHTPLPPTDRRVSGPHNQDFEHSCDSRRGSTVSPNGAREGDYHHGQPAKKGRHKKHKKRANYDRGDLGYIHPDDIREAERYD
jgi:hypothetical protein